MYDAIGAPPTTETLNLVHIPDLLLNHFPGELLPSAGFLGRIEITKVRPRFAGVCAKWVVTVKYWGLLHSTSFKPSASNWTSL